MKNSRMVTKYQKEGRLHELPAMAPAAVDPSFIPCPHCGRSFNQKAGARHIPKCASLYLDSTCQYAGNFTSCCEPVFLLMGLKTTFQSENGGRKWKFGKGRRKKKRSSSKNKNSVRILSIDFAKLFHCFLKLFVFFQNRNPVVYLVVNPLSINKLEKLLSNPS